MDAARPAVTSGPEWETLEPARHPSCLPRHPPVLRNHSLPAPGCLDTGSRAGQAAHPWGRHLLATVTGPTPRKEPGEVESAVVTQLWGDMASIPGAAERLNTGRGAQRHPIWELCTGGAWGLGDSADLRPSAPSFLSRATGSPSSAGLTGTTERTGCLALPGALSRGVLPLLHHQGGHPF